MFISKLCSLTSGRGERFFLTVVGSCVVLGLIERGLVGIDRILWLDEAMTGAFVAQDSWLGLFHMIYQDVNAPLYYLVMFGWVKLFGLSDFSLRFPSLLFGLAAPLVVLGARIPSLSREEKWTWAGLVALWFPAVWYSQEARCYSLVYLLTVLQTICFIHLVADPDRKKALWWAVFSALAILTHYQAGFQAVYEMLGFVLFCRYKAVRHWPALLVFVPVAAWICYHYPSVSGYIDPNTSWYDYVALSDIPGILYFESGNFLFFGVLLFALVWGVVRVLRDEHPETTGGKISAAPLWVASAACAMSAITIIALGFLRPSFSARYLFPTEAGLLLCGLLCVRIATRYSNFAFATMIVGLLLSTSLFCYSCIGRPLHSYEQASQDIMRENIRHVVFFLDSPNAPLFSQEMLANVGNFFFRQENYKVEILPVKMQAGQDPSQELLSEAKKAHAAIMWVYSGGFRKLLISQISPPAIEKLDPSWSCEDDALVGHAIACVPNDLKRIVNGGTVVASQM